MTQANSTAPVIIGVGQVLQRDVDPAAALSPLELTSEAWRRAADDAGLTTAAAATADAVALVDVLGWQPSNAPRLVAEAMGARPSREIWTTIGGNSPQSLVNHFSAEIEAGRTRMAMIGGVNAFATYAAAGKAGLSLDWPMGGGGKPELFGDSRPGSSALETDYDIVMPAMIYPLLENALRYRRGLSIADHSAAMGRLLHGMSKVAAANPYAWFPEERSAEQICTVTPTNRMVSFPYTKYMNSIMNVDQSSALILTSAGVADELGVAEGRRVYIRGYAGGVEDPYFLSERDDLIECPAMRATTATAFARAGLSVAEMDHFDLYSCFPVAVEAACDCLGISEDDPRGVTVTGGLPSFGGPGSNYTTHAIASMADRLRDKGGTGLVTATGWYLTKHSAGIYSADPGDPTSADGGDGADGTDISGKGKLVKPVIEAQGEAVVETYTVMCGRDSAPERGVVIGRLSDGSRFLAHTPNDRTLLEGMMSEEAVGRRCVASSGEHGNVVAFD